MLAKKIKVSSDIQGMIFVAFNSAKNENIYAAAGKESFSNILEENKCKALACGRRNPASPESGPELDLSFLFIWEWNGTFTNRPDFWFTFPYHPNFELILDRFAGFVTVIPLCEYNFSPTGLLKRNGAFQYKIALMAV